MKLPQFELWRLFASVALFGVGLGLIRAAWQGQDARIPFLILPAIACLGAAFGIPFHRTIRGAAVAIALFAVVAVIGVIVAIIGLISSALVGG